MSKHIIYRCRLVNTKFSSIVYTHFFSFLYSCSDIDITGITDYDPETPPTPIKATIVPIVN